MFSYRYSVPVTLIVPWVTYTIYSGDLKSWAFLKSSSFVKSEGLTRVFFFSFFFLLYINPPYSSDVPVDYLWDVWDSREEGSGWGKRLVGTLKAVWCRPAVHFVAIPASSILVIVLDNDYTRAWCHAFSFSTASLNYFLRLFKPGTALKARFRESVRSVRRPSARVSAPTSCQYRCFYLGCRNAMHAYCQFYFYFF